MKINNFAAFRESISKLIHPKKTSPQPKGNRFLLKFKVIAIPLVIFIITYTLLLLPQTGINHKYSEFFCSIGNKFFTHFGKEGFVHLETQKGKDDISIFISKHASGGKETLKGQYFYNINSNLSGYYLTSFLIALILATPLTWKRKTLALTLGFIIITGFMMLILWASIFNLFAITTWLGLYQDAATKQSINFWNKLAGPMTLGYSFVVIVWLALCIGKKEWRKLNGIFSEITANKKNVKINRQTPKK